jgi:hypothetical protein
VTRRAADHRECAAHRTQRAGERQFTGELAMLERFGRDLTARCKNAERDRQIEAAAFLRQIGWREIDGDPADGNSKPQF